MKTGEHHWDTNKELRTRLRLSLRLHGGHIFFTAGKTPLAGATLMPDGETLDVTIFVDRIQEIIDRAKEANELQKD